ncbi:DUF5655 domain-containing protein [Mucilaginibacter phyllosphaerae]|uniref:Uncharacterized protein n=1 Tax=Mucilaginibacter phyllosphaerae TaxID=1812349 RepID=A0A4Y8A5B2_9SPHI|nr:DUF5655 domain-containing protein [Mucilaginibacter phyllosphaerae]MBB3969538.1 hypothetical protein [Mucilaginibacter phyllosphaerae]TEW63635.1 hypothetical protein E2R65_19405 [Mucilaginibacter phyllosphaerae]GGH23798.1 hypothetical protein GCM10007352_37880 [Mucilaginibacter phyllosphaerae]
MPPSKEYNLSNFLTGKSEYTLALFNHFIDRYNTIGPVEVIPLKSMIGLDNGHKRIAYITQLGKNFIHVIFPFKQAYLDNMCFIKIPQVPGQQQFNHHFRMLNLTDINDEVLGFMQLAYLGEG